MASKFTLLARSYLVIVLCLLIVKSISFAYVVSLPLSLTPVTNNGGLGVLTALGLWGILVANRRELRARRRGEETQNQLERK
jgi:ACR3 family arsenite efflux pump ArsB